MELMRNTQLQSGRYIIEKVLGQGGFGITYLAKHVQLDDHVVIKEFFMKGFHNRDISTSQITVGSEDSVEFVERFRQKFLKEARSIRKLKHPGIIPVSDVFEENGTAYYVMEYATGGSLADKTKNGALPEAEAVRYIRQVASALEYVHSKSMMHLDVKPANILLDEDGNAILIDFGLAKQYDTEGQQTSTTPVGISHGYAPMEQYKRGGVSSFSPATDIYSLGATLYKLVTGATPPDASDVMNEGLPVLSQNISAPVRAAIEKAMQFRLKERPQGVSEFITLLDAGEIADNNPVDNTSEEDGVAVVDTAEVEIVDETEVGDECDGTEVDCFCTCTFNANGVEFKMVAVEGGSFEMGEEGGLLDFGKDNRIHSVTLSDFYICETMVTQELWQAVMGENPSFFTSDIQCPVESISWEDCKVFVDKLNELLAYELPAGRKFRLPTEAEWEYAARGGKRPKDCRYSGSDSIYDVAWFWNNSDSKTHPVKSKECNELGLYDMSGNVWEWCNDWYAGNYYKKSPRCNPGGPDSGSHRVLRGGCFKSFKYECQNVCRGRNSSVARKECYGMRLAL